MEGGRAASEHSKEVQEGCRRCRSPGPCDPGSPEPWLREDSGDAEVADLAMQATRVPDEEKRDVAEHAKERQCDPGGAVPSKMLYDGGAVNGCSSFTCL